MITFNELLSGNQLPDVPIAHQHNLEELLIKVNVIRALWGKPMTVTSGYRSLQHHLDIYRSKGVPMDCIPTKSCHLSGQAVDISDPDLAITLWLKTEPAAITCLEQQGLYCEEGNKNWVHFQTRPTKNRWFLP